MNTKTDLLIEHISQLSDIPETQWEEVFKILKVREIKAGEYYLKYGEISRHFSFLNDGQFKVTYPVHDSFDLNGRVKTVLFPGDFVGSYVSLVQKKASFHSIIATEDSILLEADYDEFKAFFEKHQCWQEVGRKIAEREAIKEERRVYELLNLNPEQRYLNFKDHLGQEWFKKVSKGDIASYLGINPSTLSRIITRTSSPIHQV